jgi:ferrous iron transport protein A
MGEYRVVAKLKDFSPGEKVEIIGYESSSRVYREKLLAMGLTRGTVVKLKKVAPFGDPVEITVRGFNLSLRKDEADVLRVRKVD